MHIRLYSELPATPTYIDPPVDQAGGYIDGDLLYLLKNLGTLHDGLLIGAPILSSALSIRIEGYLCAGHAFFLAIESLNGFFINFLLHHIFAALFSKVPACQISSLDFISN